MLIAPPNKASAAFVKTTIQKELDSMDAGFAAKDKTATYRFFAPDFYRTDWDGKKYYLKNDIKGAEDTFKAIRSVHAKTVVQTVTVTGSSAAVDLTLHAVMVMNSPKTPTIPMTLNDSESRHQTWTKSGDVWLLKTSTNTASHLVITKRGKTVGEYVNGKELRK